MPRVGKEHDIIYRAGTVIESNADANLPYPLGDFERVITDFVLQAPDVNFENGVLNATLEERGKTIILEVPVSNTNCKVIPFPVTPPQGKPTQEINTRAGDDSENEGRAEIKNLSEIREMLIGEMTKPSREDPHIKIQVFDFHDSTSKIVYDKPLPVLEGVTPIRRDNVDEKGSMHVA